MQGSSLQFSCLDPKGKAAPLLRKEASAPKATVPKHSRRHIKDKQRFVVSVVACDSLAIHARPRPLVTGCSYFSWYEGLSLFHDTDARTTDISDAFDIAARNRSRKNQ
jgi:hypothetical protein